MAKKAKGKDKPELHIIGCLEFRQAEDLAEPGGYATAMMDPSLKDTSFHLAYIAWNNDREKVGEGGDDYCTIDEIASHLVNLRNFAKVTLLVPFGWQKRFRAHIEPRFPDHLVFDNRADIGYYPDQFLE